MQAFELTKLKQQITNRNARLLSLHENHSKPYFVNYDSFQLKIDPNVFCPEYGEGSQIMMEVQSEFIGKRVMDMGTGSGALGFLAAKRAEYVLSTDISPQAITCAQRNAKLLGLDSIIEYKLSNLFEDVHGKFDLIIFNPPFLNGTPTSMIGKAIFDEGYNTLRSFLKDSKNHLTPTGEIILCFGEVGNVSLLNSLIFENEFEREKISSKTFSGIEFFVYKMWLRHS